VTYQGIMDQANKAMAGYDKARILLVPPPVIQGIGAAGGYRFMLQDREGRGYDALNAQAWALIAKANAEAGLRQVYTCSMGTPRVYADVDRRKADLLGVRPSASSRRCRSISARPSSTTSTFWAAPIASRRRPTRAPLHRGRHRQPQDPLEHRRDGADRRGHPSGQDRPLPRGALQPATGGEIDGDTAPAIPPASR
jgi:hypothetical protein